MHGTGSIRLPSAPSITGRSTPKQRERFYREPIITLAYGH
jgi:hypothetical protein